MSEIDAYDVVAANNNAAAPDGWPEGMQYSGVNNSAREMMAGLARWYTDTGLGLPTVFSANTYAVTSTRAIASYANGTQLRIHADADNTGNVLINLNSLGTKTLLNTDGTQMEVGQIKQNSVYDIVYSSTAGTFYLLGGSRSYEGYTPDIDASNIISGVIDAARLPTLLPENYISGYNMSNDAGDTEHDILISTGQATDSGNTESLVLGTAITKKIDATWAAGDDAGGFPTALSLTAGTWYRVFAIGKTDGTVDVGFDTSATATNLLADATGYTLYRRIGWVKTDATSNIEPFTQIGNRFSWPAPVLDIHQQGNLATAQLVTVTAPSSGVIWQGNIMTQTYTYQSGQYASIVTATDDPDVAANIASMYIHTYWQGDNEHNNSFYYREVRLSSGQIRYRCSRSGGNFSVVTVGWIDERGAI